MLFKLRNARVVWSRSVLSGILALLVALTVALPLQSLQPSVAHAYPAGLPTHFSFGLGAGADNNGIYGYMPNMGIPWDYAMQYLVGGVNTHQGWETWNANGTFASGYAAKASQDGFIPVFPYYELLQSTGSCSGGAENQADITHLNDVSIMNQYYGNFALLMQRLGPGTNGFGKTAIVLIEPDFVGGYAFQATNNGTCFNFCTGRGNDPSLLKASVANSGYSAVAAYPNTYAGFIKALAHLRDLYAPNVLLGLDVSMWATGDDIGLDTSTTTNGQALGQQVGTFLSKTGPHDLLVNDPLDRDAGQYQVQFGQNRWWDKLNVKFPNFKRWEDYLHGASQMDGKSVLLWQVPDGNQYFDTVNNTNGHFQDNRAEYIFNHIPELMQSGIVGAIFMPGNGGSTNFTDAVGDGVTNPSSFCTSNGMSSGQVCNSHTSTVADDDGGYLRMQGKAYYANPVPLSGAGTSATSTPTPTVATHTATATPKPQLTNTPTPTIVPAQRSYTTSATSSPATVTRPGTVALTASVKSATAGSALIDMEVYNAAGTKVFQQAWDSQSFTAGQTRTFSANYAVPASAATGTYTIMVGVFSPGWGTVYAWNGAAGSFTAR